MINSERMFIVVFIEHNSTNSHPAITLSDIYDEKCDFEFHYAMRDNIDYILDLKIGEYLYMNFNRDNEDSKGILKRIR